MIPNLTKPAQYFLKLYLVKFGIAGYKYKVLSFFNSVKDFDVFLNCNLFINNKLIMLLKNVFFIFVLLLKFVSRVKKIVKHG